MAVWPELQTAKASELVVGDVLFSDTQRNNPRHIVDVPLVITSFDGKWKGVTGQTVRGTRDGVPDGVVVYDNWEYVIERRKA